MVQNETNLVVADNSGARSVRIFRLYGGSHRKSSSIGDIVLCAVKDAIPNGKVKKGDLLVTGVGTIGIAMLINSNEPLYFKDGNIIWFQNNNQIEGNFLYHLFNSDIVQKP